MQDYLNILLKIFSLPEHKLKKIDYLLKIVMKTRQTLRYQEVFDKDISVINSFITNVRNRYVSFIPITKLILI